MECVETLCKKTVSIGEMPHICSEIAPLGGLASLPCVMTLALRYNVIQRFKLMSHGSKNSTKREENIFGCWLIRQSASPINVTQGLPRPYAKLIPSYVFSCSSAGSHCEQIR
jgi:hypothetical protein